MPDSAKLQFNDAITRFTGDTDPSPGIVDTNEANELVSQAKEVNADSSKLCGLIKSTKGKDGLKEAYTPTTDKFSPLASAIVDHFVTTGKSLDPEFVTQFESFISDTDPTPGIIDREEAFELAGTALRINRTPESTGCCGRPRLKKSKKGTEQLKSLKKHTESLISSDAKNVLSSFIKTGSTEKVISQWKSSKETWHCHWFPMKESKANGGDPFNNLFAPKGALDKYDQVFGTKSREYELEHNFRPHDSEDKDASWAGHCNNASELACMVTRPLKPVTYKEVTFSPNDIAGLLVKVSGSLRGKFDFVGARYNKEEDVATDPKPHIFLAEVLRAWGTDAENALPFVLDIDRKVPVWNYPYDQGRVVESNIAPKGFDVSTLDEAEKTIFYRAELKGTTFGKQAQTYEFWIQYDKDGSVLKSDWIEGANKKVNPDFAWRPHPVGDLSDKANWVTHKYRQTNPHVRAEDVFEIYSLSI